MLPDKGGLLKGGQRMNKYQLISLSKHSMPFFAVGMVFMGIAYCYGKVLNPLAMDQSINLVRLCCSYAP